MTNSKICLLLTGTINPEGAPGVKRADPIERENDYFISISQWLELGIPLIFCENSGTLSPRISKLLDSSNVPTEYLSYVSTKSKAGKGPGEADILDYAYKHSEILRTSSLAAKISGRYYIENCQKIFDAISKDADIDIYADMVFNLEYVDTQFLIFSPNFYNNYLKGRLHDIDEKKIIYIEHIVARAIFAMLSEGKQKWRLLPHKPKLIGFSGSSGKKIKNKLGSRFYNVLKHTIKRRLFEQARLH